MSAVIFDGKKLAEARKVKLRERFGKIIESGMKARVVSIFVSEDGKGNVYSNLKKATAEDLGVTFDLEILLADKTTKDDLIALIEKYNKDDSIHGIMLQLPLPEPLKKFQVGIIESIDSKKDIDGMKEASAFTAPVVLATEFAVKEGGKFLVKGSTLPKIATVGAKGFVGRKLIERFQRSVYGNYSEVVGVDLDTPELMKRLNEFDILISASGKESLVTKDMVKSGVVAIDLGFPRGDFAPEVASKALFVTPVPGGIGPLTIAFLFENLFKALGGEDLIT